MVCFIDGKPRRSEYRKFHIKTVKGIDDFASMREVVSRRYKRQLNEKKSLPDLILVDGGKGQLTAAGEAFEQLQTQPPLVISIAKKEELIYRVGVSEPIKLGRNNEGLKLVQAIRDEAHRFAQHYHHHLRHKKMLGDS